MRASRWSIVVAWLAASLAGCGGPEPDPGSRELAQWVVRQRGSVTLFGSDTKIRQLGQIPEEPVAIRAVTLNDTKIVDDDLARLAELKNVRSLGLYRTDIGDEGIAHLQDLETLEEIEISYTRVTDEGLAALARLPRLKKVWCHGTQVTDAGADAARKLRSGLVIVR